MKQFRFFSRCEGCKRRKWFITHRLIRVSKMNEAITSKSLLCGTCTRAIKNMIK